MDGRLIAKCILLGSLAAAGCRHQTTTSGMPTNLSTTGGSIFDRVLPSKPPGPMKPQVVEEAANDVKGPLKSETVSIFADLAVEAAFNNEHLSPAERDRRIDTARQKFQVALQQDPKSLEALRGLGKLYTRLGDRERAAQYYQTAVQNHPKSHALAHEAALSYGRFEDWQTALALWQHALGLDPESRKYPRMIGLAQARLGNYEAGFSSMLKVCGEAEARTIMARELMDAGQAAAGRQQLDLAIQADPAFAPAQAMIQAISGNVQQAGYQP